MSKEYTRFMSILGSVPAHGPLIYFDDFENLLKWSKYSGEGDSIFELDPTVAYSKNQSLHMKTRTTDATTGDSIGARGYFYMSPSKKLEQAIRLKSPDWDKIGSLSFYFNFQDGAHFHYCSLLYRPDLPIWKYRHFDKLDYEIPNSDLTPLALAWHHLSLKANFNTNKYISMAFDNHLFDLSAQPYDYYTSTTPINFNIAIIMLTAGDSPAELYIDDFLLREL